MIDLRKLEDLVAQGEHSRLQFKSRINNLDSLAAELVALSNSGGGTLLIGVNDDGSFAGLNPTEIRKTNQMLGNAANQHMNPAISIFTENVMTDSGVIIVVNVPDGISKPYLDRLGRVWLKQGSDKRHVTAREELQRMFQRASLVHADIVPVADTTSADIDEKSFRDYLEKYYSDRSNLTDMPLDAILQNLGLGDGLQLNLSGLLLFGRDPQRWHPVCAVKAVAFPGNTVADTRYLDSQDIGGTLANQYTEALAFIKRNLHRVQGNQGFNSPGMLEIPEVVLQELLVNALVHRDYFTSATIRIFIFVDRVEIISPGSLPDSLTIDDIRRGKTNRRNPTLTEHAFRLLPYRGVGSGIPRVLQEWSRIELINEKGGNLFAARINRPETQWKYPSVKKASQAQQPESQPQPETALEPESRLESGSAIDPVADLVADPVVRLLKLLPTDELAPSEIQKRLALKHRPTFRANYLHPALNKGLIEMTIPEKPTSRLQKYRLTAAGKRLLESIKAK